MNGRAYDYNLGRFLSVDPFIQEPGNSQSLNPYSYVMNNPLAGLDPSGYCSLSDHLNTCTEGLENGQSEVITDADGNEVGSIQKDKNGQLSITNGANGKQGFTVNINIVNDISSLESQQARGIQPSAMDIIKEGFSPDNIEKATEDYFSGFDDLLGEGTEDFLKDQVSGTVKGIAEGVDDIQDGEVAAGVFGVVTSATKVDKFTPDPVADAVKQALKSKKKTEIRATVDGKDLKQELREFRKERRNAKPEIRQPADPKAGKYKRSKPTVKDKAMDLFNEVMDFFQDL